MIAASESEPIENQHSESSSVALLVAIGQRFAADVASKLHAHRT